jgi:hypothetical protein
MHYPYTREKLMEILEFLLKAFSRDSLAGVNFLKTYMYIHIRKLIVLNVNLLLLYGLSCLDGMMLKDFGMLFRAEWRSMAISPELHDVLIWPKKLDCTIS